MARISVVIPVRDDAGFLRGCLDALARQTRPPDEVVVVDNGSSDDSAEVARAAGARVVWEPTVGIPRATATGMDAARGDVLVRIDADSIPPEDWLARVDAAFDADPALTALTGPGEFYGGVWAVRRLGRTLYLGGYFWFLSYVLGHPPLFGSNFAIRAPAWRRIRPNVHADVRTIHDDLDISFAIDADMRVRYDPTLAVGVSARPFSSVAALGRRLRWAFGTLAFGWREHRLVRRRLRRFLAGPLPSPEAGAARRIVDELERFSAQRLWRGLRTAAVVERDVSGSPLRRR